ncbi:MAG: class I SAM-dependent methyltransferase [Candidatus Omnitrophica bacterium]|nr:class I SAM-dependent methyltransferase [Candidatus Omnitrophota bacterium]MBU4479582.1 class I SAM-dependent methyltransferase [Candidatus Omnitrophota bacterium]MCG2703716.1 class I SAM-dependent methyltransferase [Candidatus Omnitrophota bacterium]
MKKYLIYLLILGLLNLLWTNPGIALSPKLSTEHEYQSFKDIYSTIEWFKNIKEDLEYPLADISDFDIEQSTKLVVHSLGQSNDSIQKIIVCGNGLMFMPILFALMGKDVIFIDADVKYYTPHLIKSIEKLRKNLNNQFKFSLQIIESEIGALDYQTYNLRPHSFDLITFIDFSGGIPVGEPTNWMETAKVLLKPEAYLIIDHEYSEKTVPQLKKVFPEHTKLPVLTRKFSHNMVFEVETSIPGTYGGMNHLYRVKNSAFESSI